MLIPLALSDSHHLRQIMGTKTEPGRSFDDRRDRDTGCRL